MPIISKKCKQSQTQTLTTNQGCLNITNEAYQRAHQKAFKSN